MLKWIKDIQEFTIQTIGMIYRLLSLIYLSG